MTNVQLLVDISNIYAANQSKLGHLHRGDGYSTGGLYGSIRSINALLKRLPEETHVTLCFDAAGDHSIRREVKPDYKANRDRSKPMWYRNHKREIMEWARHAGHDCAWMEGGEADDVIFHLTTAWQEFADERVTMIMSKDHDMKQLLGLGKVFIRAKADEKGYDAKKFIAEFGFGPERYREFLAMSGDVSDNIIGPFSQVHAKQIMAHTDDWAGVLALVGEDVQQELEANFEFFTPLDMEITFQRGIYDQPPLVAWYQLFAMNSLVKAEMERSVA